MFEQCLLWRFPWYKYNEWVTTNKNTQTQTVLNAYKNESDGREKWGMLFRWITMAVTAWSRAEHVKFEVFSWVFLMHMCTCLSILANRADSCLTRVLDILQTMGTWSIFEIHGFLNGLTHEYPLTLCTENQRIKIFLNINIWIHDCQTYFYREWNAWNSIVGHTY